MLEIPLFGYFFLDDGASYPKRASYPKLVGNRPFFFMILVVYLGHGMLYPVST